MEATEDNAVDIHLDDDVEGARIGSPDYCFVAVGEPVPVAGGDGPEFDPQSPPLQPLAVSEQLGIVFVAHSNGFFVARTKEVIQLAKEIKEKNSTSSMKESCIVDVPIGKVYILALSADSSSLAASVAGDIHFFSVSSLLNKEQSPFSSSSLGNSSSVKDLRWTRRRENQYVVLSNQGKLYCGAGQDPIKHVMDNVDAVEWSVKGKFLAVATNNVLNILSSGFKQKFSMSLSFKSWVDDSDFDGTVKVDSIRWIRPDCIILGSFQLSADGMEENYLIQVVTSKDGKITDASSQPILLSFSDVFEGLIDDIVPFGSGPYMSLDYVDKCELAIAANRKNTDQHIVLLGWPDDNEKQAAVIDILRDTLCPKISLQENGDDNIVLGLCLDKVSYNDEVEVVLGADYKKLSPFCLLLCLSLDAKLSLFQVASAAGVSAAAGDASLHSEEEDDSPTAVASEDESLDYSSNSTTESVNQVNLGVQSPEIKNKELDIREGQISLKDTIVEEPSKHIALKKLVTDDEPKLSGIKQIQDTIVKQSPFSGKQGLSTPNAFYTKDVEATIEGLSEAGQEDRLGGFNSQSFPAKSSTNLFTQSANLFPQSASSTLSKENDSGGEVPGKLGSATLKAAEDRKNFAVTSGEQSSFLSAGYSQPNSLIRSSGNATFSGENFGSFSTSKPTGATSSVFSFSGKVSHSGLPPTIASGTTDSLPANHKSPLPFAQSFTSANSSKGQRPTDKDNNRITSSGRLFNSEPHLSKQVGNVEEMIRELDNLLECIDGPGGFREACTVQLNNSVLELEKGMGTLFGRWRKCKKIMDEQLVVVQLLRDKTVQVAAKKIYMEGIVKPVTDGQYWDHWNRQKLSPELELKRQHILKVNQELTSQLIELGRHLNTLEIKAFGEDRGKMRQRGFTSRYGSSRDGQSLRSLQDIMSSQLAVAEQLSESLSRQMTLLSVELPTTKKQDARRELFEEIGIPYSSASFSSPEEKRVVDTPSNKVLVSLHSADVNSSSRRNQLTAIRSLGSDSARRRRDSLDWSWASFEPPKTTVKRISSQEGRRTPSVDRSSSLMEKEHAKSLMMERTAFARSEPQKTPSTTLQSSDDRDVWERTSKQGFEATSALNQTSNDSSGLFPQYKSLLKTGAEAHQTTGFSKRVPEPAFSLSKSTYEMSNSSDKETSFLKSTFGASKDGPSTSSLFSQSQGLKSTTPPLPFSGPNLESESFQSDNASNQSKSQSGLFASSSHSFSIFGSSTSLNSSFSVLPTSISMDKSSSNFKASTNVIQTAVPSQSLVSSPTVFAGSSFQLSSSFSVPSTSPPSSVAPLSPAISVNNSSSSFKTSTIDREAVLPPQPSVSSPLLSGGDLSSKVPEKPVPSPMSAPSMNLPAESLKKEPESPRPEVSSKIEENAAFLASSSKPEAALKIETSVPTFIPTSEASILFQAASNASLTSTALAVSDASNSKPEPSIAKDFLLPAVPPPSEIGKTENQNGISAQEDDMEEEAPEMNLTTQLSLGGLGGFGLGSAPNSATPKPNPFGSTFANATPTPVSSPMSIPTGQLFRPASLSFQSPSTQAPQPTGFGVFSGGFGAGNAFQAPAGGGFGQPSKIGAGQQALGSVLGSFGQSRQFGVVQPVGGFGDAAADASGGGGAGAASSGVGGFGGMASSGVGGFGRVSSPNVVGFAGVASASGGFGGAAGGFGGAAPGGGFGAFNSQQGSGGFSSFGNSAGGTARPPSPSELFTKMRK